ncbi:tetratricopeptide repeat protein [Mycobacterium sp. BK558]|nr:tetratricopeptide repeat protein [Mycobacterium sp. BK558]
MADTHSWSDSVDLVLRISATTSTLSGPNLFERAGHDGAGPGLENAVDEARSLRATLVRSEARRQRESDLAQEDQSVINLRSASLTRAGSLAWQAFLRPPLEGALRAVLAEADLAGRTVRMGVDPGPFGWVPWEGLRDPGAPLPLALRDGVAIYRVCDRERVETMPGPLRVLFAISAPIENQETVLDYENELRNVETAVSAARHAAAEVRIVNFASTEAIHAALLEAPVHVLHVTGHGSPGTLVLEDPAGRPRLITADEFAKEAFPDGRAPLVVSLAACSTGAPDAELGTSFADGLIGRGIPAVIATETSVTDIYATEFFANLYRILATSETADLVSAVADARRETHLRINTSGQVRQSRVADLDEWSVVTVQAASPRFNVYDTSSKDGQQTSTRRVTADEFTGRRAEQRVFAYVLDRPGSAGVVIQGIGGVGKSALLRHLITHQLTHRLAVLIDSPTNLNDLLTPIGRTLRQQATSCHDKAMAAALLSTADIVEQESLPKAVRIHALNQGPASSLPLVVAVDGFEHYTSPSVEDDIAEFVTATIENNPGWRFVMTTRRSFTLPADAHNRLCWLHLGPLSRAESLKAMWSFEELGQLSDVALNYVWEAVGGHPLSFRLLDEAMQAESAARAIKHLSDHATGFDVLHEVLASTIDHVAYELTVPDLVRDLTASESELLLRMSVFRVPVDMFALLYQLGDVNPDVAPAPAHESLHRIADILRENGTDPSAPDLELGGLSAETLSGLAPLVVQFIAALLPPISPDSDSASAAMTLAKLCLISQETCAQRITVNRSVAKYIWRTNGPTALKDAHRRAARYWRWRANQLLRGLNNYLFSLQEARYHLLLAGDIDEALSVTDAICNRLHDSGEWNRQKLLVDYTLEMLVKAPLKRGIWLHRRGNLAYQQGDLDAAEADYRRAIEIHTANGQEASLAAEYGQLAMIARARGDNGEAKRYFERCLAIYEACQNRSEVARTLGHLGTMAFAAGDFDEARTLLKQSLVIREDEDDYPGIAASCNKLGLLALAESDFDSARSYLDRSREIREKLGLFVEISDTYQQLGILARELGDDHDATDWFRRASNAASRANDLSALAAVLHQQGRLAYDHDDFDEAERLFGESLSLEDDRQADGHAARSRFLLGDIALNRGDRDGAFARYIDFIDVLGEDRHPLRVADAQTQLARIERARSNMEEAVVWLLKAEGNRLRGGAEIQVRSLEMLSEMRSGLEAGRFDELVSSTLDADTARRLCDQLSRYDDEHFTELRSLAERLAAKTGSRLRERAKTLMDDVRRDQTLGQLSAALHNQRDAVSVARAIQMQEGGIAVLLVAETLQTLATLVWNRDHAVESVALASEAAYHFGSVPATLYEEDPFEIVAAQATSQWTLGIILSEIVRDYERGLAVTQDAVATLRAVQSSGPRYEDALALALHNLGVRLGECGRADEALVAYLECLALTDGLAGDDVENYEGRLASCLVNVAGAYIAQGQPTVARDYAERAVKMRQRQHDLVPSEERVRDLARSLLVRARAQWAAAGPAVAQEGFRQAVQVFQSAVSMNPSAMVELQQAQYELAAVRGLMPFAVPEGAEGTPIDLSLSTGNLEDARCPVELRPLKTRLEAGMVAVNGGDVDGALRVLGDVEIELQSSAARTNLELDLARISLLRAIADSFDAESRLKEAASARRRALELVRRYSSEWDALKALHAELAHALAGTYGLLNDLAPALEFAHEAAVMCQELTDKPQPHHRFKHLPALAAYTLYLGELKARSGDSADAVETLIDGVGKSRECVYDHRYLDDWATVMRVHVRGLLSLSTAFSELNQHWPSIAAADDAIRVAHEIATRDGPDGMLTLAQALTSHAHCALRLGKRVDARNSAEEAIQRLENTPAGLDEALHAVTSAGAYSALGESLAADDKDAALLALIQAAERYRFLFSNSGELGQLIAILQLRVSIGNLLVQTESHRDDVEHNAEVLTELVERHRAELMGQLPERVRVFLVDNAASDVSTWSSTLKSRIAEALQYI